MASLPAALATLRDVAGITGSFVFTNQGRVVAREIHPTLDDVAVGDAAERLSRIHETFAAVGDQLDFVVIRFREHKLYLKVLSGGMLCILANDAVNMAALRMASSLVARRITPELQRMDTASTAATAVADVPPAPTAAAPVPPPTETAVPPRLLPVTAPGTRRFRGREVE